METIIKKLSIPLSDYCVNVCHANCCKVGKIILCKNEFIAITNNCVSSQILQRNDGYYELSMSPSCPSLKDSKCLIYNTINKPRICSEYPFFLRGTSLFVATSCLAIQNGVINLEELKSKGIKVIMQ